MKRLLYLVLLLVPAIVSAGIILPYKPTSRVSDIDQIFDPKTRDYISQTLKTEYAQSKISVYVVAMDRTEKGEETTTANQLRDKWITDPMGMIILFTRVSDKISISLTPAAFKVVAAGGKIQLVANKIDEFNEAGPSRGMPMVTNLLLDRVRPDRKSVVVIQERDVPVALILVPICVVLAIAGVGMFKLYQLMVVKNVFTPVYELKSPPIKPILGSSIGGVNTAEAKY